MCSCKDDFVPKVLTWTPAELHERLGYRPRLRSPGDHYLCKSIPPRWKKHSAVLETVKNFKRADSNHPIAQRQSE